MEAYHKNIVATTTTTATITTKTVGVKTQTTYKYGTKVTFCWIPSHSGFFI